VPVSVTVWPGWTATTAMVPDGDPDTVRVMTAPALTERPPVSPMRVYTPSIDWAAAAPHTTRSATAPSISRSRIVAHRPIARVWS